MDSWKRYLAGIVCFICFCRLFEQFLPGKKYRKYSRFFLGLMLLVLCLTPFLQRQSLETMFEDIWRMTELREEGAELKKWQEDAANLQTKVIYDSFQNRLKTQIEQIAKEKGMITVVAEVTELGREELLTNVNIRILGSYETDKEKIQKEICAELKTIYGIQESQVSFCA